MYSNMLYYFFLKPHPSFSLPASPSEARRAKERARKRLKIEINILLEKEKEFVGCLLSVVDSKLILSSILLIPNWQSQNQKPKSNAKV
jgi:hypothetical protein